MKKKLITAALGSAILVGAISVSVAQSSATAEQKSPEPQPSPQSMSATDMINYLKEEDTKFIIETTNIDKERLYEVSLQGLDSDEKAVAFAKALGLRASKEGLVWILREDSFPTKFFSIDENGEFLRDFEKFSGITKKDRVELEKTLAETRVNGDSIRQEVDRALQKSLKLSEVDAKDLKEHLDNVKMHVEQAKKSIQQIQVMQIEELMKSITPEQWKLMEKNGHLKQSDLTKKQLEMIGNPSGDGEFNITIQRDGKTLKIKN